MMTWFLGGIFVGLGLGWLLGIAYGWFAHPARAVLRRLERPACPSFGLHNFPARRLMTGARCRVCGRRAQDLFKGGVAA